MGTEGKTGVEGVRAFLAASSRQFEREGIFIARARFMRSETGELECVLLDYEERDDKAEKPP